LKGFKVIARRTWLEDARSGAWAVAISATAAEDNALRQTEVRPAHLSMVIGETLQSKGVQRMGSSRSQRADCVGSMEEAENRAIFRESPPSRLSTTWSDRFVLGF
jgi:hypothetical protein